MIFIIVIISLTFHHGLGICNLRIAWQSNLCASDIQAIPADMYLPSKSESCDFSANNDLIFVNEDRSRVENVYQVKTLQKMIDCDASDPENQMPLIVNDTATIHLVTGNSFSFSLGRIHYFISTSNGTHESANSERKGPDNCLSMIFMVIPTSYNCEEHCREFQFGKLSRELIPNCENTAMSTRTPSTSKSLLNSSTTPSTGNPPVDSPQSSVEIWCETECVLIIMISLLMVIISIVCCIVIVILVLLCIPKKILKKKRPWKKIPSKSKSHKDPEKGEVDRDSEKKAEYQLKKISTTEDTKKQIEVKEIRLLSDQKVAGSVMKYPECRNQKTNEITPKKGETPNVSNKLPFRSQDKKSSPKMKIEIKKIQSPSRRQTSPTARGAKRILPQIRSKRLGSPKVSPAKTVV